MQKNLPVILMFAVSACSLSASAQAPERRYDFSFSSGAAYEPLSASATLVDLPEDWDDEYSEPISLPFDFNYLNTPVTSIVIETYGSLLLNGIESDILFEIGHISGISTDYDSKSRGKIYYETTGTEGNRVFKIEYRNVGRFMDTVGNDTLNFQIWLYENDNAIEYRAGYGNVPDTSYTTDIMELEDGSKDYVFMGLLTNSGDSIAVSASNMAFQYIREGSPVSDSIVAASDISPSSFAQINDIFYESYPDMGDVFRFIPVASSGMRNVDLDMASVSPNPTKDGLFSIGLKENPGQDAALKIFDISGKLVHQQNINTISSQVNISELPAGNYIGHITDGDKRGSFRIVKQ